MATTMFVKQGLSKHQPKTDNYACQICRAPHEICSRCATAKRIRLLTPAPSSAARRRRPLATLSS